MINDLMQQIIQKVLRETRHLGREILADKIAQALREAGFENREG